VQWSLLGQSVVPKWIRFLFWKLSPSSETRNYCVKQCLPKSLSQWHFLKWISISHIYFCVLLYNAVSISGPITPNDGMTDEWRIGRIWKEALMPNRGTILAFAWTITKQQRFCQDSQCPCWDSKQIRSSYKSGALQLHQPACSFCLDMGGYPHRFHCIYALWQMQILRETKSQYLQCRLTFTVSDVVMNMWNSNYCYCPWN
jgi:hypothetical protein